MKKINKTTEQELREVRFLDLSERESDNAWKGIHARINSERSFSSVFSLKANKKTMIPLLIGALLFASAGGTVAASNSAVPGDALFGVDRAVENVRLALADKEAKAELKVRFSEERLDEVRKLVARVKAESRATTTATTTATTATTTATSTPKRVNTNVALGVNVAIAFLNDAAASVSASGNAEAAAEIRSIVSQLENLANDSDVKVRLKQNGDFLLKLQGGTASSTSATTTASTTGSVKINTSGNKSRIEVREDGERIRIEIKDSGEIKVKSKIESEIEIENEDDDRDEDENEDENEKDDRGRNRGSDGGSFKLDFRLR